MFTKNEWVALHLAQENMSPEARMFLVWSWANYVKTHNDQNWSKLQNITINHSLKYMPNLSAKEYLRRKGELYRLRRHQDTHF